MPPWLTSLFIHPEFVIPGAALLSLPIIIHFINRLRYRRVKWAAMEFLLASQQRNRSRILLEQLLLLFLRLLAVAALVMLVARPLINPEQFSFFQGQKTHHLVLLDDSGSMRDRWGETSGFDEAKNVIRKIAAEGERKPDTQTLTLLLASNPGQPVFTQENLNPDFAGRLETTLKGLPCSHQALDLAKGAESARRMLIEQHGASRNLHLISDFRLHDWADETAVVGVFRSLQQDGITLNLVKTVPESHPNLAITDLSGAVDVAAAGVPLRLSATVRNDGEQVAREIRLSVAIDGRKLPTTELIESLEPGKETTREFDVVFPATGPHDVEVSLPADALEQDNHRFLSLDLPEGNPVLIISGNPSSDDAFFLTIALAPAPGITGFSPTIESADFLRRHPIDRFQSVFLLNVAELSPDAIRTLEQYVSGGGGLAWYLGDQVRTAFYNDKLYREGHGLFPAKLGAATELAVDEANPAPDVILSKHPAFRVFDGGGNSFLDLVRISRYFSVSRDWVPPDGVQVIGTLRNKAPLLLEHRFGKGTIFTSLTAIGDPWNNWPRLAEPFVAMQLEVARHIARRSRTLERKVVGEPIVVTLDAAVWSPQVEVRPPDGSRFPLTLGVRPPTSASAPAGSVQSDEPSRTGAGSATYEESYRQTDSPGLYAVLLKRQDSTEELRRFAFNVPDAESHLRLVTTEIIQRRLGPDVRAQIQEPGDFTWVQGKEGARDIQDFVLIFLAVLLLVEQAFALRLSYHPESKGVRR